MNTNTRFSGLDWLAAGLADERWQPILITVAIELKGKYKNVIILQTIAECWKFARQCNTLGLEV